MEENEPEKFRAIIADLKSMVEVDQAMRNRCTDNPDEWDETVDHRNTKRLKAIVDEIGWPSISKVGHDGSSNAWLLIQHADHDPDFQKICLKLMKSEPEGEVSKQNIAYLEDRIAVGEGRPQIYGTQFHQDADGQLEPQPIEDVGKVDERRKDMGLETLDEYKKHMQEIYGRNST